MSLKRYEFFRLLKRNSNSSFASAMPGYAGHSSVMIRSVSGAMLFLMSGLAANSALPLEA